ncbi:sensor histidine kinase [Aureispira anguillae]|uniref:Histidine kinase n=1 Tax=Aureispira anguillae TaxID=2864201 RepID=A0A915YFS4_9BACT|nr:histidine kinase [Aureispira anguillae]BDS12214.1 histidine kinase [Aureispira anguillae]
MDYKNNIGLIFAHITFWLLLAASPFYFNTQLFGISVAIVRTVIPISCILMVAYGNNLFIIKQLFRRKNFVWYYPFLAYSLIIPITLFAFEFLFEFVNTLTNIEVSLVIEARQHGEIIDIERSDSSFPRSIIGLIVIFTLFVSSLYGLAIEFMQRDRQEIKLKAANLKNELKLLRSQMNPHFLFNAMNNLYAIVQLKPEKAGEFVLKLSDMLRYVTYDCQNEKVSIHKEIDYLNNYIYFQKWRDQNFQDIDLTIEDNHSNLQIEPMLLIPFVENAFKHSYDHNGSIRRWVKIHLKNTPNKLIFEIQNNLSTSNTQEDVPDEYMGIGIENVRKRLELLYKNKHQLHIKKTLHDFQIQLIIQH